MTNELITTFGSDQFEFVAAATGANVTQSGLPNLKLNRNSEDEASNTVPVGTYTVSQDGIAVYAKNAKFRVFLNTYQYMAYDAATNKFTNKSIIVKNFNEQAIDEHGGIKCGKISAKELLSLSEKGLVSAEDKISQRAIKCYRGVYGLLTMDEAVTADGTKAAVVDLPVLWRMSGDNFNGPKEALDAITKMRHLCFQHWLNLDKPEKKKQGSNVYYVSVVQADLANVVEFTSEDMATFQAFQTIITNENNAVAEKWRASKRISDVAIQDNASILADLDLNDSVDDL